MQVAKAVRGRSSEIWPRRPHAGLETTEGPRKLLLELLSLVSAAARAGGLASGRPQDTSIAGYAPRRVTVPTYPTATHACCSSLGHALARKARGTAVDPASAHPARVARRCLGVFGEDVWTCGKHTISFNKATQSTRQPRGDSYLLLLAGLSTTGEPCLRTIQRNARGFSFYQEHLK